MRRAVLPRLTPEIVMAAREGGSDPESNFRLRLALDKARAENMPKENIERGIRRGAGEDKEGSIFEQITFEGFAPHGAAERERVSTGKSQLPPSKLQPPPSETSRSLRVTGRVGGSPSPSYPFSHVSPA